MRSKVLRVMDYRAVDLAPMLKAFVLDGDALERELRRVANPYIRWEAAAAVTPGSQVVCRLRSSCERFQREAVRFVAGSGMFHRDLEALAAGMAVGETRGLTLPEGRVELTVLETLERVVPEPDDEMVRRLGLEGVSTLAEYRAYLAALQKEKYLESALYEPARYLRDRVLEESEFLLFKEDWRDAVSRRLERSRVLARQEGLTLEKMTPEQFEGRIPVTSYHQLVAMLQDTEWDTLRMHLLGKHFALTDGFSVSQADYEAYIADYVKTWRSTEERAREVDPYESFAYMEYANHAYSVLSTYVKQLF